MSALFPQTPTRQQQKEETNTPLFRQILASVGLFPAAGVNPDDSE